MSPFTQNAVNAVKKLWHSYLIDRDAEHFTQAFSMLSAHVTLIGTGEDECFTGREELMSLMYRDRLESKSTAFEIVNEEYHVNPITDDVCVVYGRLYVREQAYGAQVIADMDTRFSIVCHKSKNGLAFDFIHHSIPFRMQLPGESYPKTPTEQANLLLRRELSQRTEELGLLIEKKRKDEARYKAALEAISTLVFEVDSQTRKLSFDHDKFNDLFCAAKQEVDELGVVRCVARRLHPDDREAFIKWSHSALDNAAETSAIEFRLQTRTGVYMWMLTTLIPIFDKNGSLEKFIGHVTDIDNKKRNEERLISMAETDSLTHLLNRRSTETAIDDYLKCGRCCGALLMVDVDNFKQINDSYGHLYGDKVLVYIAQKCRELFRAEDVLGRIGGDEYIIFLKGVNDRHLVEQKAQRLRSIFETPFLYKDAACTISLTIGIALSPLHGSCFTSLWEKADKALYTMKRQGKHNYLFFEKV